MAKYYRPTHVTQKDGSPLQFSNCRMAVLATHLDFHTKGKQTTTAAKMRSFQFDQQGGTDADDARIAWERGFKQELVIRNGKYWEQLVEDRSRGWFISLDVWYASMPDRCQASASFGHTVGVSPETNAAGDWLVSDPLCGGWKWMRPADLKRAAEEWGRRVLSGASGKTFGPNGDDVGDTGGAVAIRYTTAVEESMLRVTDTKAVRLDVPVGVKLYDVNGHDDGAKVYGAITQGVSPFASRIGSVAARAIYANIGGVRQIRLVRSSDVRNVTPIEADAPDMDALLDARDKQWIDRLTPPR